MRSKNILVTGCGGDIGQSIGKILKTEYNDLNIIGCDIYKEHAGQFIFDVCKEVPRVNNKEYLKSIKEMMKKFQIDLIIPTSEAELKFYLDNKISYINKVPLVMPDFSTMEIGNDKFLTQKFLKDNNLPFAWTVKTNEGVPKEFPCVLKHISGKGSKDIKIISETEYKNNKWNDKDFIYQEYIPSDDEEYTCGLFRGNNGIIKSIIFNRKLTGGYTGFGEVIKNESIEKLLENIAVNLDLRGSINVQLRIKNNEIPIVFEINSRFSSTVLFRYMLGFKDLIWSIDNSLGNKIQFNFDQSKIVGSKIYKGWQEYYVDGDGDNYILDNKKLEINVLSR